MSSLIRLDQLSKSYQTADSVYNALKGISLTVERGEMTAIVGKSGSGKSTLMNILGFLDIPTMGHYYFDGIDVSALSDDALSAIRNQQIGFVFQSFFLLPRSTALQNVMLPLSYRGVDRAMANEKAMAMLDKVGMLSMVNKYPNQLSGGQQQRVAIARALVGDPTVILADEPTGALDSQTGDDIMRLLRELNSRDGKTVLIITHDQAISAQCQRIIHIKDGQL